MGMKFWVQLTDLGSGLERYLKQIKMNLIKLNPFISALGLWNRLNVISGKIVSELWTLKELRKNTCAHFKPLFSTWEYKPWPVPLCEQRKGHQDTPLETAGEI